MPFFVLRTHSHTDKQMLWKVMSRPISGRNEAESWKDFCESQEKNKEHRFFVAELPEGTEIHKK